MVANFTYLLLWLLCCCRSLMNCFWFWEDKNYEVYYAWGINSIFSILFLPAKPYFIFPLKAQHIDVGSHLTWRCEARGRPEVTYSWYKNSQFLDSKKDNVEIHRNSLVIKEASAASHNGMYQCAATNSHGTTFSSAQLRVLSNYVFTSEVAKIWFFLVKTNILIVLPSCYLHRD